MLDFWKETNLLKKLRKELKLTQEELAKALNLSISYYVKLENGFMNPSYKVMKSLWGENRLECVG